MTIFGWDMSHFDAPGIGNAVGEGIAFLTHKAGGDRDDPEIGSWWSGVKGLRPRVLLGAYWVLYPGRPVDRADDFLDRLDSQCPGWREGPFILQVDCERWNDRASTVPGLADIRAFCDRLRARMPRLRPIVYAPKWVYGDTLRGLGYPLWASSYVTGAGSFRSLYPGDASPRWGSYSGQTPAILQYTSSATIGSQTTCDANAYRGTLADLTALVAPGWKDEDDMPLSAEDKNWITTTITAAVKNQVTAQLPAIGRAVLEDHRFAWSATAGSDYRRNLADLVGDVWFGLMFGTTRGKDTPPAAGALARMLGADVDEQAVVAGVLRGLGSSDRTPEQIAAVLAPALGDQAAAVGAALQSRPAA